MCVTAQPILPDRLKCTGVVTRLLGTPQVICQPSRGTVVMLGTPPVSASCQLLTNKRNEHLVTTEQLLECTIDQGQGQEFTFLLIIDKTSPKDKLFYYCANAEYQGKLKAGLGLTNLAAALAKRVKFGPSQLFATEVGWEFNVSTIWLPSYWRFYLLIIRVLSQDATSTHARQIGNFYFRFRTLQTHYCTIGTYYQVQLMEDKQGL